MGIQFKLSWICCLHVLPFKLVRIKHFIGPNRECSHCRLEHVHSVHVKCEVLAAFWALERFVVSCAQKLSSKIVIQKYYCSALQYMTSSFFRLLLLYVFGHGYINNAYDINGSFLSCSMNQHVIIHLYAINGLIIIILGFHHSLP